MSVVTWVLAVLFLASGVVKLARPKEKLIASGMGWAEHFSPVTVKAIGGLEILAAVGLTLPTVLGIVPVLVPLAAAGLALLMAAAMITHLRRREPQGIAVTLVLLALAGLVAISTANP